MVHSTSGLRSSRRLALSAAPVKKAVSTITVPSSTIDVNATSGGRSLKDTPSHATTVTSTAAASAKFNQSAARHQVTRVDDRNRGFSGTAVTRPASQKIGIAVAIAPSMASVGSMLAHGSQNVNMPLSVAEAA